MIYKDARAKYDTQLVPASRPNDLKSNEPCLNCHQTWLMHNGWNCGTNHSIRGFSDLTEDKRYLTQSMKDSISSLGGSPSTDSAAKKASSTIHKESAVSHSKEKAVDLSDWRTWAHNHPGDCPCGIAKVQCSFHK